MKEIRRVLEEVFGRGFKHGLNKGCTKDGQIPVCNKAEAEINSIIQDAYNEGYDNGYKDRFEELRKKIEGEL